MANEEKLIFKKISKLAIAVFFINLATFIFKVGNSIKGGVTGMSIKSLPRTYAEISATSKIFLVMQWVALISLLLFVSSKERRAVKEKEELKGIDIKKIAKKNGTDLDTLYDLLKKKKQLRVSTIEKVFNIKKSTAMDWCKILESGNLATIDYSAGGQVIKIN